jgi:hypothetical protein
MEIHEVNTLKIKIIHFLNFFLNRIFKKCPGGTYQQNFIYLLNMVVGNRGHAKHSYTFLISFFISFSRV